MITEEDVRRKASALTTLLGQMDIPEMRKDVSSEFNLRWISRNIGIRNSDHPMYETAREMIKTLLKWHARKGG